MLKKISLKDIATKVGVSTALVSYVLNNQKTNRISKESAQKIRKAAEELNYRSNFIAKSLKTKKTSTIGLIVADISNPFFSCLARIIEDEAEKNNYTVIFGSSDECAEKSSKLINVLLDHQVDGFIIAPAENSEKQLLNLQKMEIPFVLIDRTFPLINAPSITIDNYKAAFTAIEHLIHSGCKRIAILTFKTLLGNFIDRTNGYRDAIKKNRIDIDADLIKEIDLAADVEANVQAAINELMSLNPTVDAIFFTTNMLSTYGLKYINSLSIKVPEDLSVISFDESMASELFYAPITHIKQPLKEIGKLATDILMESINGHKKEPVVLPSELIIRKSTKPCS